MRQLNNILFVATGGDAEQMALAQAASLAETCGARRLTILDVTSKSAASGSAPGGPTPSQTANDEPEQRFHVAESPVMRMAGGPRVELQTGRSLRQVIEATRTHDLAIKPASAARAGRGRRCPREDRKVLSESRCPVWLVKKQENRPGDDIATVLAAVDLSAREPDPSVATVLARADELARETEANLQVAAAWQIPYEVELRGRMNVSTLLEDMQRANERQLHDLAADNGAQPQAFHLMHGDPLEVLPRFVQASGADLVVLRTAERSGLQRLLRASTAERVLATAGCSVFAVNGQPAVKAEERIRGPRRQSTMRSAHA